jgi:transketolase
MGVMDRFGESGKGEEMLEKFNLTAKDIVKKIKENL